MSASWRNFTKAVETSGENVYGSAEKKDTFSVTPLDWERLAKDIADGDPPTGVVWVADIIKVNVGVLTWKYTKHTTGEGFRYEIDFSKDGTFIGAIHLRIGHYNQKKVDPGGVDRRRYSLHQVDGMDKQLLSGFGSLSEQYLGALSQSEAAEAVPIGTIVARHSKEKNEKTGLKIRPEVGLFVNVPGSIEGLQTNDMIVSINGRSFDTIRNATNFIIESEALSFEVCRR